MLRNKPLRTGHFSDSFSAGVACVYVVKELRVVVEVPPSYTSQTFTSKTTPHFVAQLAKRVEDLGDDPPIDTPNFTTIEEAVKYAKSLIDLGKPS